MAEYQIRALNNDDLGVWFALEQQAFSDPWSEAQLSALLGRARHLSFGCFNDKQLVAFAVFSFVLDEAELLQIAVAPDWRGQGLAERLFTQVAGQLKPEGIQRVLLEVRLSNQPAISLYRRIGFIEDGYRKAYYETADGREDALLMSLLVSEKKPAGG
ncbi:MAG: ribosomal protein S18-alanine N-acetyltransferase [Pontibacterium sp.]